MPVKLREERRWRGGFELTIAHAGRDAGRVRLSIADGRVTIDELYVQPEQRRRGIASRVLGYLRALLPDAAEWVADGAGAEAFFAAQGFVRVGDGSMRLTVPAPVRGDVADYLRREILPRYAAFDEGHDAFHALGVMGAALGMAREYCADATLTCAAAACHDIGLAFGREEHHLHSGRLVRADERLHALFTQDEVEQIARACEDHRASGERPRDLLGCIIADSDREIEPHRLIYRTLMYGRAHFPDMPAPQQYARVIDHIRGKYGPEGYMRPCLDSQAMRAQQQELWRMLEDGGRRIVDICIGYDAELTAAQ